MIFNFNVLPSEIKRDINASIVLQGILDVLHYLSVQTVAMVIKLMGNLYMILEVKVFPTLTIVLSKNVLNVLFAQVKKSLKALNALNFISYIN